MLLLPLILIVGHAAPSEAAASRPAASPVPIRAAPATSPAVAPVVIPAVCRTAARRAFIPKTAAVLGRRVPVYALGRSRGGVPKAPPLTSTGKQAFGWDKYGPKPGARRGNVRFNAHTYPDGSALGNRLLARLRVGHVIVLRDARSSLCYQVTKVVVTTPRRIAAYYVTQGSPKLAIVVCSGRRLGPGRWTHRTIWYAKPFVLR